MTSDTSHRQVAVVSALSVGSGALRTRAGHLLVVTSVIVIAGGACSGDEVARSTDESQVATADAGTSTSVIAGRAEMTVHSGASTFVAGDAVWRGGGLDLTDADHPQPITRYRRFDSAGAELRPVATDVDDGFVFSATMVGDRRGSSVLVENRCPIPLGENLGCSAPTSIMWRIGADGELQRVVTDPSVLDEPALLVPVGLGEDVVRVVAETLDGTSKFGSISLVDGSARVMDLPDGVDDDRVCSSGGETFALAFSAVDGTTAMSARVLHLDGVDSWTEVARTRLDGVRTGSGIIACDEERLVWTSQGSASVAVVGDLPKATLTTQDLWPEMSAPIETWTLCASSTDIVASGTDEERRTAYVASVPRVGDQATVEEVAGRADSPPVACPVGDAIVDLSQVGLGDSRPRVLSQ